MMSKYQPKWHFSSNPDAGVGACGQRATRFITDIGTFMAEPRLKTCGNCRNLLEKDRHSVYQPGVRGGRG